jgi:protein-L-isoaspartate(D-aspartate) O-methyltransferase
VSLAARKIRLVMHLRQAGIADTAVLAAIERIPREQFVPETFQDQAYENTTLPIGHGQTLSAPEVVARMTQALASDRRMKVLEIGTGSGYQTAVLSRLSRRVYTIERYRELLDVAEQRLSAMRLHNITALAGDGWQGWDSQAPFQRIIVTAAAHTLPGRLVDQLGAGGILVAPVGQQNQTQELLRLHRDEAGTIHEESLGAVRFVPLVQGEPDTATGQAVGGQAGGGPSTGPSGGSLA